MADYAEVFALVIATVSESVAASMSSAVRETVAAVGMIEKETSLPVTVTKIAERLDIDKSSALRRVQLAIKDGYLSNAEDQKGRPAKLTVGEPLLAELRVLPTPDDLEKYLSAIPLINRATVRRKRAGGLRAMNAIDDLLANLTALGATVTARGDRLKIDARVGVITPELRERLAEHKAALCAHLAGNTETTPAPPAILHRIPLDIGCTPSEWQAARGLRVVGGTSHFGGARRPVL